MKRYGLVGYPLGHSFSKLYFEKKFQRLGLSGTHRYDLYEIENLKDFPAIWDRIPDLEGLNVTVPHKINVIRFLDHLDTSVHKVEAVNVVKKRNGKLIGYNSDQFGFSKSLTKWLKSTNLSALIFGSGGSSLAVQSVLRDLDIDYKVVSRKSESGDYLYTALEKDPEIIEDHLLLINTTPLGMYPNITDGPPIPYELITNDHHIFDLIYNPSETLLMREGRMRGAEVINGMEMFKLQAEKSWQIWTA